MLVWLALACVVGLAQSDFAQHIDAIRTLDPTLYDTDAASIIIGADQSTHEFLMMLEEAEDDDFNLHNLASAFIALAPSAGDYDDGAPEGIKALAMSSKVLSNPPILAQLGRAMPKVLFPKVSSDDEVPSMVEVNASLISKDASVLASTNPVGSSFSSAIPDKFSDSSANLAVLTQAVDETQYRLDQLTRYVKRRLKCRVDPNSCIQPVPARDVKPKAECTRKYKYLCRTAFELTPGASSALTGGPAQLLLQSNDFTTNANADAAEVHVQTEPQQQLLQQTVDQPLAVAQVTVNVQTDLGATDDAQAPSGQSTETDAVVVDEAAAQPVVADVSGASDVVANAGASDVVADEVKASVVTENVAAAVVTDAAPNPAPVAADDAFGSKATAVVAVADDDHAPAVAVVTPDAATNPTDAPAVAAVAPDAPAAVAPKDVVIAAAVPDAAPVVAADAPAVLPDAPTVAAPAKPDVERAVAELEAQQSKLEEVNQLQLAPAALTPRLSLDPLHTKALDTAITTAKLTVEAKKSRELTHARAAEWAFKMIEGAKKRSPVVHTAQPSHLYVPSQYRGLNALVELDEGPVDEDKIRAMAEAAYAQEHGQEQQQQHEQELAELVQLDERVEDEVVSPVKGKVCAERNGRGVCEVYADGTRCLQTDPGHALCGIVSSLVKGPDGALKRDFVVVPVEAVKL